MKEQQYKTDLPKGVKWPDDQDFKWFAINPDGEGFFYTEEPKSIYWPLRTWHYNFDTLFLKVGYFIDLATEWSNTLVKRV